MKKLIFGMIIIALLSVTACATQFIEIKRPDHVYSSGKPIYSVEPGDKLEVLNSKTCAGGSGLCYRVRNVKTGEIGFVIANRMKEWHRIYTEE